MGVNLRGYLTADLPPLNWPLAGHAGDCAKVTTATVTGNTGAFCTCSGAGRVVAIREVPSTPPEWVTYVPCTVCSPAGPCESHWISK
jgi:hypothetical protein